MNIKKTIILFVANLNFLIVYCQENNKYSGFFDNDNLEDTINYKFFSNQKDGLFYKCRIICGNGKEYNFDLGVGFENINFYSNKKGILETSQIKDGMQGFETNETYIYKNEYDNWILIKSETINKKQVLKNRKGIYVNEKKEVYKPIVPTGIDGKEYQVETKTDANIFLGIYKLNSCQDSRFKIEITKNGYLIFDKEKIIAKGKVIQDKNNFILGKIKGIFSKGNLEIENYHSDNTKLLHFTQCEERHLTFFKMN